MNDDLASSTEECLVKCQALDDCKWFAYNQDLGICGLLETCDRLDNSGEPWISGEVSCSPTSSTTTPATPTTSTAPIFSNLLWIDFHDATVRLGIRYS